VRGDDQERDGGGRSAAGQQPGSGACRVAGEHGTGGGHHGEADGGDHPGQAQGQPDRRRVEAVTAELPQGGRRGEARPGDGDAGGDGVAGVVGCQQPGEGRPGPGRREQAVLEKDERGH